MYYKQKIGKYGEDVAVEYLKRNRYKILSRNYKCKYGEIDIIAKEKEEIVFVEVKCRTNLNYGFPAEAVNKKKIRHIYNVAENYIYKNYLTRIDFRFDVIEVFLKKGKYEVNHLKNIDI